jgi:ABC-type sulfate/molybdate transport systems ATPase subunit
LLEFVNIGWLAGEFPDNLSCGQQKLVDFIRSAACATRPDGEAHLGR